MKITTRSQTGFTLLELSVVLTIIGLLLGSIFVGQALIFQAKIHKMMKEVDAYKAAVNTFRLKYACLPGDCAFAYQFFGDACGTNTYSMGGCNGNGDGVIAPEDNTGQMGAEPETYLFWSHLAFAGLSGQQTTGMQASTPPSIQVGVNIPRSNAFTAGGYTLFYYNSGLTSNNTFPTKYFTVGQIMTLGGTNTQEPAEPGYNAQGGIFTPLQMFEIDTKYDDGIPYSGQITGWWAFGGNAISPCTDGDQAAKLPDPTLDNHYNITDTNNTCIITFLNVF